MTIQATPSEQSYAADGVTTVFAIPFPFDTSADLKLTSTDASGNILTLTTGFTISGGGGSTGNATFTVAPAVGLTITIYDDPARTQPTNYVSLDAFPAESHERALDRVTRIAKRLYQLVQRSVRFPDGDVSTDGVLGSVANRKGKYLFFNAVTGAIEYAANIVTTTLSQSIIGQLLNPQTAAEVAAAVIPTSYFYVPGDVRRYGGDPLGVTPADTAWANNVAQASKAGGAEMVGPGTYLLTTGIVIATDGVKLRTSGIAPTTFKANANNMILVKVAASRCSVGSFAADANGHTGVEGLTLAPANEADTTHTSQINFNTFGIIELRNGLKEGIRMRAGPTVLGVDSGVFYNVFEAVWQRDCIRAIWMQDTIAAGNGAPNRNTFLAVRGGSSGVVCNTGIQIDSGTTNKFFGTDFEGIANGTVPNTVPTAVKVVNKGANGLSNDDNHFFGCFMEANTRDLDNTNSSTQFFGGFIQASKCAAGITISSITRVTTTATVTTATNHGLVTNQRVRMLGQTSAVYSGNFLITVTGATTFTYTMLSDPGGSASVVGTFDVPPRVGLGIDPSLMPMLLPGMQYGEGVPGYASGYWGMLKEIADLNLNWQAYTLTTGQMTNVATIGGQASKYRQLSNMVSWHAEFTFNASVAGTQVTMTPPVPVNLAHYTGLFGNNAWYSLFVEDGTGTRKAVEAGWTSAGLLYIKAPTAWNVAGNNNAIFLPIEYHI